MARVTCTRAALIGVLLGASVQSTLANEVSDILRAFPDERQRATWNQKLKAEGIPCDAVVRIMYQGTSAQDESFWSIGCHDGSTYNARIMPGPAGEVRALTCAALDRAIADVLRSTGSRPGVVPTCWTDLDIDKHKTKLVPMFAEKCTKDLPKIDGALEVIKATRSSVSSACSCVASKFVAGLKSSEDFSVENQKLNKVQTNRYLDAMESCVKGLVRKR